MGRREAGIVFKAEFPSQGLHSGYVCAWHSQGWLPETMICAGYGMDTAGPAAPGRPLTPALPASCILSLPIP